MLRPHKNSDLHCAYREHQKVRLIDSIISFFENSLLLKSLDLINNRKKRYCGDSKKVQVGKDQEKAQSESDSHSKNRGGKKTN